MLFNNIMVAFDGSKASNQALQKAIELVKLTNANLNVVHIYEFPRFYVAEGFAPMPTTMNEEFYELASQTADKAEQLIKEAGVTGKVELIQGPPAETILEYAASNNIDAIVIGSRGLGGIREFVLGSVSHNVVQHAKIPVLVVK